MENRPHIVIIQNQLEDLGGVSKFCGTLASGLIDRGYQVEIGAITPPVDTPGSYYSPELSTWTLVPFIAPQRKHGLPGILSRVSFEKKLKQFRDRVEDAAKSRFRQFDQNTIVIFTQLYAREQISRVLPSLQDEQGFRVIGQYHNSYTAARAWGDLGRVMREYPNDDQFLCLTQKDAVLFQKAGLNNSGYVLNPVQVSDNANLAPLENKTVISLSRYDPVKQVDHMVRAWSTISDEVPDWQLHLYGSGPSEESVREYIRDLGLEHSVRLMGQAPDVTSVLQGSSISVNSSSHEGLPLALMEASALGVPSVVYDCSPGMTEIVEDGVTGFVIPEGDVTALARGVLTLIQKPELRKQFGKAAHQRMLDKFGIGQIIDQWEKIFYDVVR